MKGSSFDMLENELTVIVICYDPYFDAIELSPLFMKKYWANCSANVIYVSSNTDVSNKGFKTVFTNGDLLYYRRLEVGLECVHTPYVMLLLDDYLIDKTIDENKLLTNINYMKKNNVDFCQLYTMFAMPPGKKNKKEQVLVPKNNIKYRINLQPAIFKKSLLEKLLVSKPLTAWDAELAFMSKGFEDSNVVFALNKSFSVTNYIDKGYATRKGYRLLKNHKMWHNQRKIQPFLKGLKMKMIHRVYFYLPNSIKKNAKKEDGVYKG